ncbi:ABC-type Fe3+/spermidine/putrescine transport system ATPase subunit [Mesorhizobium soli]|uniref:ABC transporter ATP-binding protein n=1 Tax=Pseudaminobacter soli (ex Li et al. 2025) TaxID=1295366 RepID=UPI002473E186|nr:ABC transporter ATP-binding protein [Mesorhizobium soli]MDH6233761.1 ABC-type Fe3+/spermidine/putrescine transport system ATPase subunit [Mesorhizobium soli]
MNMSITPLKIQSFPAPDRRCGKGTGERPIVSMRGVRKAFGGYRAVDNINLEIFPGDFVAILGPSGCGKTTLLRMIGGFLQPDEGAIEIDGVDVTKQGPAQRPTNTVFQGYGLFPHMSVRQNIGYGLKIAGRPKSEIDQIVDLNLGLVRMTEFAGRNIRELSGGQQQRVALARALAMRPKVLLLDESLAALDLKLRQQMQSELRAIHQEIGGTFVFVTHDQGEAFSLANKVAVMNKGRIEQFASPSEIYHRPATSFVATFVGEANVFKCRRDNGVIALTEDAVFQHSGPSGDVTVMVRPENIKLLKDGSPRASEISLKAKVADKSFQGSFTKLSFIDDGGREIDVNLGNDADLARIQIGEVVTLFWPANSMIVFDE